MLVNEQKNSYIRKIVIRLINGSLRGCEFTLLPGKFTFIVSHEDNINRLHQGNIIPDNTIYIPCSGLSPNFEIIVPEDDGKLLTLREFHHDGTSEKLIESNSIITIGKQIFYWRDAKDDFSDDILTDYANSQTCDVNNSGHNKKTLHGKKSWWKVAVVLAIIGCVSAAGYSYLNETQRHITSVSEFLDNKVGDYNFIYGKDDFIYIFSESEGAAQWAIQSMIRTPLPYRTKILTIESEEQRIGKWIESNWPQIKIHRVRLDTPEHPVIEVSSERTEMTKLELNKFTDSVVKHINYASAVSVREISDQKLRQLAIDGLEKLSLSFTEVKNNNSITFVILGSIDDGEFERLKKFITHYSQIWKGEYVQFAIELKDDWLKGKSFKYGAQGYVKLSPGHWYFPRNIKKEL